MGPVTFDEPLIDDLPQADDSLDELAGEMSDVGQEALPAEVSYQPLELNAPPQVGHISTAKDLAVRDVVREQQATLERWRKRTQVLPPQRILSMHEWVGANLPELTQKRRIREELLDHVHHGYALYLKREQVLADIDNARARQRPTGLEQVREDALAELTAKYGDPVKVLQEYNAAQRAPAGGASLTKARQLEDAAVDQINQQYSDPVEGLAALGAAKRKAEPNVPDEVNRLKQDAAKELRAGKGGPAVEALSAYSQAQSTRGEESLITPSDLSDILTKQEVPLSPVDPRGRPITDADGKALGVATGLAQAIQRDPIGGWGSAVELLGPLRQAANEEMRAKIDKIINDTRPTPEQLKMAWQAGYFHRPEDDTYMPGEDLDAKARTRLDEFLTTHGYPKQ